MDISMVPSMEDIMDNRMGRVVDSSFIVNTENKQEFQLSTDLKGWIFGRSPVFNNEK